MIRKATYEDVPELMEVFGKTREIMRASGNLNQWNDGYPSEEIVRKDFDSGADRDSGYMYGPTLPRTFFFGVKLSY